MGSNGKGYFQKHIPEKLTFSVSLNRKKSKFLNIMSKTKQTVD